MILCGECGIKIQDNYDDPHDHLGICHYCNIILSGADAAGLAHRLSIQRNQRLLFLEKIGHPVDPDDLSPDVMRALIVAFKR